MNDRSRLWWLAAVAVFAVLATANGAGYRFGVSDQAFYIPVVERALDPAAFPRDGWLIDAQGTLMVFDQVLAGLVGAGLPIEAVFFGAYLLSLALVAGGLLWAGSRLYSSPWAVVALVAAFTLRHRIAGTSANSLEPYFHPRVLAFGIGLVAVAALLHRRRWLAVALVAAAALVHVTTGAWFGVLIGTALAILDRRLRVAVGLAAAAAAGVAAWAVTAGPLQASLVTMDGLWLQAVASKDSLFVSRWPWSAWLANFGMLALLWWAHRRRLADGAAAPEDTALLYGAAALATVFIATVPLVEMRLALPVQLQISRVFWVLEAIALLYLVGAFGRHARTLAIVLLVAATSRGAYVMLVERPDRPLVQLTLAETEWHDAMAWLRRQPLDVHVLADPGHAWRFGSSVRVSAGRDVFLEDVKDSAVAIYSRRVAARVVERLAAVQGFASLTPAEALALAGRYDLDVLVVDRDMALPLVYRNERFRIYNLNK